MDRRNFLSGSAVCLATSAVGGYFAHGQDQKKFRVGLIGCGWYGKSDLCRLIQVAPVEVIGDDQGWVAGLRCLRMELGEPDASGRRRPIPVPGSEFTIPCDMVVVAIGTRSNPLLTSTAPELEINEWGYMTIDDWGMTSLPGVFAGGDIVRGAATVILAMGDGKRAAAAIDRYLRTGSPAEAEEPIEAAEEPASA